MRLCTRRRRRLGAASVEMAVMAPFFLLLLFGLWEVGRVVDVQQVVDNAAREGGRQASSGKYTAAEVQAAVLEYFTNAGLPTKDASNNVNVTVTAVVVDSTGVEKPTDPIKDATQLTHVRVRVTYPYSNVRWAASSHFIGDAALLHAQCDWYVAADVPITVPSTIPSAPLP